MGGGTLATSLVGKSTRPPRVPAARHVYLSLKKGSEQRKERMLERPAPLVFRWDIPDAGSDVVSGASGATKGSGVHFHGRHRRRARGSGGRFGARGSFPRGGVRGPRWRGLGGSRTASGQERQAQQKKGVGFHNQEKGERVKLLTRSCMDVHPNGRITPMHGRTTTNK